MKSLQTLLLFLMLASGLQAQGLQGGILVGGANYAGDVVGSDVFSLSQTSLELGAFMRYNVSESVALKASFLAGKIKGDETVIADPAFHQQRNITFQTSLSEIALLGEIDLLGKRRWKDGRFTKTISPYIYGGIGATFYNPDADFSRNTLDALEERIKLDQQIKKGTSFTVPFGAGIKFDVSRRMEIAVEGGARPAFHDKLDGVSASGNPDLNDWYYVGGVTLGMRLGKKDSDGDGIADDDDTCPDVAGVEGTQGCPDADADGVPDADDACPAIAGEKKLAGCPDLDGDGVADKNDLCPEVEGIRRFDGCPDTDGDGIPDKDDTCPDVAGLKKVNGCPDADRDGVADNEDNCPNAPGVATLNGCPDADGDGITDAEDTCPNQAGVAAFKGCADSDGDGIADPDDKCPGTVGAAANGGCPALNSTTLAELAAAAKNIQFNPSSDQLTVDSYDDLNKIADILTLYPDYLVKIDGYTDSIGSSVTNLGLSQRRARACYLFLIERGIASRRLSFEGHGESNPIGNNKYAPGRKLNRRVEFKLFK